MGREEVLDLAGKAGTRRYAKGAERAGKLVGFTFRLPAQSRAEGPAEQGRARMVEHVQTIENPGARPAPGCSQPAVKRRLRLRAGRPGRRPGRRGARQR